MILPLLLAAAAPLAPIWAPISFSAAVTGIDKPVWVGGAHDGSKRLFVVQQDGLVKVVEEGKVTGTFLDARALLGAVGGEQGLLGIAFHSKFKDNGRFFIAYTDKKKNDAVAEVKASA